MGLLVLSEILCEGRISVFYRELKEKGLVYSYYCGDLGRPRDNLFVISATFEPSRYEEVKNRIFELLRETYNKLNDQDVEEAKKRILNSRIFEEEKVENEAFDIGYSYTVIKDLDFYRFFEQNLKVVRRVDLLKIFERYLKEDKYSEILMVPKGD